MDALQRLARMADPVAPTPAIRDAPTALAMRVAAVSDRLSEDEVQGFIDSGVTIHRQAASGMAMVATDS